MRYGISPHPTTASGFGIGSFCLMANTWGFDMSLRPPSLSVCEMMCCQNYLPVTYVLICPAFFPFISLPPVCLYVDVFFFYISATVCLNMAFSFSFIFLPAMGTSSASVSSDAN